MIKRLLTVVSLIVVMILNVTAVAQSVGLVDMRRVFQTSPQIQQINTSLEKQFWPQRERVIGLGRSLQDNINKLQRNESVMNKKEVLDLRNTIQKQQNQLREVQGQFQQNLFTAQNKAMTSFMKKVSDAVARVAKKEDLCLVFPKDTVFYTKDGKDITSDVLFLL